MTRTILIPIFAFAFSGFSIAAQNAPTIISGSPSVTLRVPIKSASDGLLCSDLNLEGKGASDLVHERWATIRTQIQEEGFSIAQLRKTLNAMDREINASGAQKRAIDMFKKQVQAPTSLVSGGEDVDRAIRKSVRDGVISVAQDLDASLTSGDEPFSMHELEEMLIKLTAVQSQIAEYKRINKLAEAMTLSKSLTDILPRVQNAVLLVANMGEDAKRLRLSVLDKMTAAFARDTNLISTKCRIWEVLRD